MSGELSVTPVENVSAKRRDGKKINWIRPPNPFHRVTVGVSPLNLFPACKQQAQILQQILFIQLQFLSDPIGLQRNNFKASFSQSILPKRNPAPAKSAGIIIKNPAFRIGFGFTHVFSLVPLCTFTSEPSARKADDGGRFKESQKCSPYNLATLQ